jgi:hypothetical protein
MSRPTPKGGFGNQGEDFTVMRQRSGRIIHNNSDSGKLTVDDFQNAIDPHNIYGEDS